MTWCPQAISHYLSKCRPRFMSTYGHNELINFLLFSQHCFLNVVISNHSTSEHAVPLNHYIHISISASSVTCSSSTTKKPPFKLAILYNKSIADAHPSFLLEEAILWTVTSRNAGIIWWPFVTKPFSRDQKRKVAFEITNINAKMCFQQNRLKWYHVTENEIITCIPYLVSSRSEIHKVKKETKGNYWRRIKCAVQV